MISSPVGLAHILYNMRMQKNNNWLKRKDSIRLLIPSNAKGLLIGLLYCWPVAAFLRLIFNNRIPHRQGVRIDVSSPRIPHFVASSIFFGVYERAEIDQAQAYIDTNLPVVELGASIGVNTMQILKLNKNKCLAVEADPEIFAILQKNLNDNFADYNHCQPINCAIDYSGSKTVTFERSKSSLAGAVSSNSGNLEAGVTVSAVTLNELLDLHQIDQYNLVIDIEGAEAGLIVSDAEALSRCHRLIGEFDGGSHQQIHYRISELVEILQGLGFTVLHTHGNRISFENSTIKTKPVNSAQTLSSISC